MNTRRLIETVTHYWIHRSKYLPFGTDLRVDLKRICPNFQSSSPVFDVGANVGQSIPRLRACFPSSSIYCFEPVALNFQKLTAATRNLNEIRLEKVGLSKEIGSSMIHLNTNSTECSLEYSYVDGKTEIVEISTLDTYCEENRISHIAFLKLDIEGHEIHALQGALRMLSSRSIDFIFVEAEIIQTERHFITLQQYVDFLKPQHYSLISLYDQTHEWNGFRSLQFVNILFGRNDLLQQCQTSLSL